MTTRSISNIQLLKIKDEITDKVYYGCDQEWFTKVWQRLSGCGPSVAANLIRYNSSLRSLPGKENSFENKKNCLLHMEEVWEHVTPKMKGVNTTRIFYEGLLSYVRSKGLNIEHFFLDVPKSEPRPLFSEILSFIDGALQNDAPVAFLNLCNGKEKNLDRWHWVTVVSMDYEEDGSVAFVNVLDEGIIKKIDLFLWYHTTTKDGGFVYIR